MDVLTTLENYKIIDKEIKVLLHEAEAEARQGNHDLGEALTGLATLRALRRTELENMVKELPPLDSLLIRLFYFEQQPAWKVARECCICEREVFRRKKKILKALALKDFEAGRYKQRC